MNQQNKIGAMLKKHGINPCSVKINRDKKLDALALTVLPIRRSTRIMVNKVVKVEPKSPLAKVAKKITRTKSIPSQSAGPKPKSILGSGRLRGRSKSATFDVIAQSSDEEDTVVQPAHRTDRRSFSIDLPRVASTLHQSTNQQLFSNIRGGRFSLNVPFGNVSNVGLNHSAHQLSSDEIRGFENRIACLVESNNAKINRIQLLAVENKSLVSQIESMDRINRSMAGTIDAYQQADEQNSPSTSSDEHVIPMNSKIQELNAEINILRDRILRLNHANLQMKTDIDKLNRSNAFIKNENEKLNDVLKTYSAKVSQEHNYHM